MMQKFLFPYQPFLQNILAIIAMICLSSLTFASSESDIQINEKTVRYDIGQQLHYHEDATGKKSIYDITSGVKWTKSDKKILSFGYTNSTYWLKFTINIDFNTAYSDQWVAEISSPTLEMVEFYGPSTYRKLSLLKRSGATVPFHEWGMDYNNLVFSIPRLPEGSHTFYFKVKTSGSYLIPIHILSAEQLSEERIYSYLGWGTYVGLMAVMFFYNLFIYTSVRDESYIYYSAYVLACLAIILSLNGLTYQFLWPDFPKWNELSLTVLGCLAFFTATLFTRVFLHTNEINKHIDRILIGFAAITLTIGAVSAVTGNPLNKLSGAVVSVFPFLALLSSAYCIYKGSRPARYFFLAWAVFLGCILFYMLSIQGFIPVHHLTFHSLALGSGLEVVLLSFGLADRINLIQKEKEEAQLEAKRSLVMANRALKESSEIKDEFLSTMSHELTTPINGMIASLDLMKNRDDDTNMSQLVDLFINAAEDLHNHHQRIITFAELQSGRAKLIKEQFDLNNSLNKLRDRYISKAIEKQINFRMDIESSVPHFVLGDRAKFESALAQILDNAIKFTDKGHVTLHASMSDVEKGVGKITFDVIDSGVGISSIKQKEIIKPFQQGDSSFSRKYGGIGLGLATTSQILHIMHGQLAIQSELNQGTTVTLDIPLKIIETPVEVPPKNPSTPTHSEKLVLVVEDQLTNMKLLVKILEKLGYKTLQAENGQIALDKLEEVEQLDAILMDCQMPVMDGYEATRRIKQIDRFKSVPIIAVTANSTDTDRQSCKDAGMDDFIAKPIKKNLINDKLEDVFSRSS